MKYLLNAQSWFGLTFTTSILCGQQYEQASSVAALRSLQHQLLSWASRVASHIKSNRKKKYVKKLKINTLHT